MKKGLFIIGIMFFALSSMAQKERRYVRDGNEHYEEGYYDRAEESYNQALDARPDLLEAEFNRGTALFRQEKFEEAADNFNHVATHSTNNDLKASAFHNQGNSLMAQQDLEGAIEAYKNALRTDPSREDSRHNLALAQQMLKQQQQQDQNEDQQNKDQQDQEEQDNQDQQQDDNGEGDQGDQQQEQGQDQNEGEDQEQDGSQGEDQEDGDQSEQEQRQGEQGEEQSGSEKEGKSAVLEMSEEEMERLLQSLIREEQNTQDKVNKKKLKGQKIKTDKDW